MAAILGLRGSGDFTTDERPKDWREKILQLYPNGDAPLMALSSMGKNEGTTDPEYNWWEKRLPTQRLKTNGTIASGALTLVVDSGAKDCVAGTVLLVETTSELLYVDSDPSDDLTLSITRSFGAVAAAQITDDYYITIVGNVHEEGAEPPSVRAYAPTKVYNYTEIFRTAMYLTRTARRTRLRWDNQGPYREAKRECLSLHSIEMEKAMIFGDKVETTGPRGKPMRMTGGVISFLTSNLPTTGTNTGWAVGGLLSESVLDDLLEDAFRYGSNEKLVLAGSTWIKAITTLGKRNGDLQMMPTDKTYGMAITRYLTPFGTLMIKNHPLFSQHSEWRKNALLLDMNNIMFRPLDETMFIRNRQTNGEDASMDEYMTEIGMELHYEETHGWMTGVTGALAA